MQRENHIVNKIRCFWHWCSNNSIEPIESNRKKVVLIIVCIIIIFFSSLHLRITSHIHIEIGVSKANCCLEKVEHRLCFQFIQSGKKNVIENKIRYAILAFRIYLHWVSAKSSVCVFLSLLSTCHQTSLIGITKHQKKNMP